MDRLYLLQESGTLTEEVVVFRELPRTLEKYLMQ